MDSKHYTKEGARYVNQHSINARKEDLLQLFVSQNHTNRTNRSNNFNGRTVTMKTHKPHASSIINLDQLDQFFTDTTASPQPSEYNTKVTIRVQGQRLKVKVDFGAEVYIMGYTTCRAMNKRPPLRNTSAKLKPYGSKPLLVKGCFRTTVINGQQVNSIFYVTEEF